MIVRMGYKCKKCVNKAFLTMTALHVFADRIWIKRLSLCSARGAEE